MDIEGKLLGFDPAAATADAERVKHRLSSSTSSELITPNEKPTAA